MAKEREVCVHLLPQLAAEGRLRGGVAVVIDVLRATTTVVHAFGAGCKEIRVCAEVEEARSLASQLPAGKTVLAGERGGKPLPGFDLGNSPAEFTSKTCQDMTVVLTTSNGTRALVRAAEADRTLVAAFVNYSAVCEQLRQDQRPVHILCSGIDGEPALEDTLLAGAFVEYLCEIGEVAPNDSARLAWDCFENHGRVLAGSLEISQGGRSLIDLGYANDLKLATEIDKFPIVPELRRDPLRLELGAVGIVKSHWQK